MGMRRFVRCNGCSEIGKGINVAVRLATLVPADPEERFNDRCRMGCLGEVGTKTIAELIIRHGTAGEAVNDSVFG